MANRRSLQSIDINVELNRAPAAPLPLTAGLDQQPYQPLSRRRKAHASVGALNAPESTSWSLVFAPPRALKSADGGVVRGNNTRTNDLPHSICATPHNAPPPEVKDYRAVVTTKTAATEEEAVADLGAIFFLSPPFRRPGACTSAPWQTKTDDDAEDEDVKVDAATRLTLDLEPGGKNKARSDEHQVQEEGDEHDDTSTFPDGSRGRDRSCGFSIGVRSPGVSLPASGSEPGAAHFGVRSIEEANRTIQELHDQLVAQQQLLKAQRARIGLLESALNIAELTGATRKAPANGGADATSVEVVHATEGGSLGFQAAAMPWARPAKPDGAIAEAANAQVATAQETPVEAAAVEVMGTKAASAEAAVTEAAAAEAAVAEAATAVEAAAVEPAAEAAAVEAGAMEVVKQEEAAVEAAAVEAVAQVVEALAAEAAEAVATEVATEVAVAVVAEAVATEAVAEVAVAAEAEAAVTATKKVEAAAEIQMDATAAGTSSAQAASAQVASAETSANMTSAGMASAEMVAVESAAAEGAVGWMAETKESRTEPGDAAVGIACGADAEAALPPTHLEAQGDGRTASQASGG